MDGSEDHLFGLSDDEEEGEEEAAPSFEGFSAAEIEEAVEYYDNIVPLGEEFEIESDESDENSSDEEEMDYCPGSPGR